MVTMVIELQEWQKTNLGFETLKCFVRNISTFISRKYYNMRSHGFRQLLLFSKTNCFYPFAIDKKTTDYKSNELASQVFHINIVA